MIQFIQPLPQQMWDYTVELNGVRIRVSLNTDDVLKNILPTEVYHIATDDDRTDFSLYAILTSSVSEECVFHSETTSFGKPHSGQKKIVPIGNILLTTQKSRSTAIQTTVFILKIKHGTRYQYLLEIKMF